MKALKCRECGREYPLAATHVCEFDFGPLEVAYDYERIKKSLTRAAIESRPKTMWRYRELLPVAQEPTVGQQVGFTPLIKADRLAKKLGIRELCYYAYFVAIVWAWRSYRFQSYYLRRYLCFFEKLYAAFWYCHYVCRHHQTRSCGSFHY